MNIKKIFIMIMCTLMLMSITSCNEHGENNTPTTIAPTTTQPTTESPTEIKKPENIGNMTFETAFYKPRIGTSIYNTDICRIGKK